MLTDAPAWYWAVVVPLLLCDGALVVVAGMNYERHRSLGWPALWPNICIVTLAAAIAVLMVV